MADRITANAIALAFLADRFCHSRVGETAGPFEELVERFNKVTGVPDLGNTVFTLRWYRSQFTTYQNGQDKVLPERELRAILSGFLVSQGVAVSRRFVGDVTEAITGLVRIDNDRDPPFWIGGINGADIITAKNGNISSSDRNPATGRCRLLPHSPLYYTLAAPLPFAYDPDATCPRFQEFLNEIMGGDIEYVNFLWELLGYLFMPGNPYQVFVLLLGSGANGKSTLIRVVEWLVGPGNVSHVPLGRFGDRFSLHEMIGRRANTGSETITSIDAETEARLKELTGGDTIAAEIKFVQGRVNFTPSAKIIIATNQMPQFRDRSSGLWRRLWVVPFPVSIPEGRQDPRLAETLSTEAPGILNRALEARDRLIAQGGFTVPSERASLLEDIRRSLDPVREFLATTYAESANGDYVPCAEVFASYTDWCHLNGVRSMDERLLGQRIRSVFPAVDRKQRGPRGSQLWVYLGIHPCTPSTPTISHSRAQGEEPVCIGGGLQTDGGLSLRACRRMR